MAAGGGVRSVVFGVRADGSLLELQLPVDEPKARLLADPHGEQASIEIEGEEAGDNVGVLEPVDRFQKEQVDLVEPVATDAVVEQVVLAGEPRVVVQDVLEARYLFVAGGEGIAVEENRPPVADSRRLRVYIGLR